MESPPSPGKNYLQEITQLREERKRLIELGLELVWELQSKCPSDLHKQQEKELEDMRE